MKNHQIINGTAYNTETSIEVIEGIFVQWIKYIEVKGSKRAMHFYLTNEGKSTQSFKKAKNFKTKEDAVAAAKEFFCNKEWCVFQQTEIKVSILAMIDKQGVLLEW